MQEATYIDPHKPEASPAAKDQRRQFYRIIGGMSDKQRRAFFRNRERKLRDDIAREMIAAGKIPEGYVLAIDVRTVDKIGRNDPCPCGSGLKFKKCCIDKSVDIENQPEEA